MNQYIPRLVVLSLLILLIAPLASSPSNRLRNPADPPTVFSSARLLSHGSTPGIALRRPRAVVASSGLPPVIAGANVDITSLLPGKVSYVMTPHGDLFDLAHDDGLDAFRVTTFHAPGQPPATAADWQTAGQRALATGVSLIPLLTLEPDLLTQVSQQYPMSSSADITATVLISDADRILGQGGLAASGATPMVDINNEKIPSDTTVGIFQRVTDHIHAFYPGVLVTIGGWSAPADGQISPADFAPLPGRQYIYNYAPDGAPFAPVEDVVSVHLYDQSMPNRVETRLETLLDPNGGMTQPMVSQAVVDYLRQINQWSGGKPILVEEFGAASGLLPDSSPPPISFSMTPELQAALLTGVLNGVVQARQQGINVIGGTAWILSPRGGQARYGTEDNAFALVIPPNYGSANPSSSPIVLPGVGALCSALQGILSCAASTPTATVTTIPTPTATVTTIPTPTATVTTIPTPTGGSPPPVATSTVTVAPVMPMTSAPGPPSVITQEPTKLPELRPTRLSQAPPRVRVAIITVSLATVWPGTRVTITGRGFSGNEDIVVALNGVALSSNPVRTTRDGFIRTSFVAPATLLAGPNALSAIGTHSLQVATAILNGLQPHIVPAYFTGGMETATEHATLQLLNRSHAAATVHLTFYRPNGAIGVATVHVPAATHASVALGRLEHLNGAFGLAVTSSQHIVVQLDLSRAGQDGDSLPSTTELGRQWYLAEGYTGLSYHETVALLNPSSVGPAYVHLHLLPFGGRGGERTVPVTVPMHANVTVDINHWMPARSVSIVATANRPILVERTLSFGVHGYGLTTRVGTTVPANAWLLAEGTTANHFQTYLTILNPGNRPARVMAVFFGHGGGVLGRRTLTIVARSRATIAYNEVVHASGAAAMVTSDQPIAVERPEYLGNPNAAGVAGSDVFGCNGTSPQWSFPGGNTGRGFSEFLLFYNPSGTTIPVDVTLFGAHVQPATKRVVVEPWEHYSLNVAEVFHGAATSHGVTLRSVNEQAFVAEQTLFKTDRTTLQSTQGLAQ